jgi:hypothetical protein
MIPITLCASYPKVWRAILYLHLRGGCRRGQHAVQFCTGWFMNVITTDIPEILVLEPKLYGDHRGFFCELFQAERYVRYGICRPFVQDNLSRSTYGVLRGLHLQHPKHQGKLVTALRGRLLDVAVDVRRGSPTFGRHVTVELSEDNRRQVWVPFYSPDRPGRLGVPFWPPSAALVL